MYLCSSMYRINSQVYKPVETVPSHQFKIFLLHSLGNLRENPKILTLLWELQTFCFRTGPLMLSKEPGIEMNADIL